MIKQNKLLVNILFLTIGLFILTGLIVDGPLKTLQGFISLQLHPARLINDFIQIAGIGPSLFNSALVGLVGLLLVLKNKVKISGPTFAAVLTLMGFGLFGKTVLNIFPIFIGVFLSGKFVDKEFKEYIIIALFGTALGPIISFVGFELGFTTVTTIIFGSVVGIATGFLLPSIAVSMLHLHQGYNLYNMGLTCGFFGLFLASIIKATGHDFNGELYWYSGDSIVLKLIVPCLSMIYIVTGLLSGKKKAIKSFSKIQSLPGRLPSDFMDMVDINGALINAGLIGLLGSAYIFFIDGDFNGPVIGGLLTIVGFAAFGTHLRNSWSVVAGVVIGTLLFGRGLNEPGPILAAIFVTTLSPLAGQFGFLTGILAGFVHLIMVLQTSSWHGGINLYNNGFAGGLTATVIVAVIQWYKTNKVTIKNKFRSKYE